MGEKSHKRPVQAASAALHRHLQNTTTVSQIESLSRLHGNRTTMIDHAEKLVVDMKGQVPDSGIEHGVWHQLTSKKCNGVFATSILVSDDNATYIDLCTGVVVTVDQYGRRKPSMIGGVR